MSTILLSQAERTKQFGIECSGPGGSDGILFRASTWLPGGEYIQKLTVKNVSSKVQKFKYKLPSTRYFSLAYPEEIILSPGIHVDVDVIFRPVEYEPYDDTMYIKILDGVPGHGFHVPVRATIDKLILSCPPALDLGFCTTHQFTTLKFLLTNTGEIEAPFKWESPFPFVLEPSEGSIPVGCAEEITITIMPTDASVYACEALCHVGTGVHAIIPDPIISTKLSAKAKYAFLSLSEEVIPFGEVVSGMSAASRKISLRNTSVVPAEFDLVRFDHDRDEVFGIYPKSGVIPPLSEIGVSISYTALAMGCYSLDRYTFRTPGGCDAILTCSALSVPPQISLCKEVATKISKFSPPDSNEGTMVINGKTFKEAAPEYSLNFRDVEVGKVETRLFYLRNDSNRPTPFSIVADENGTFQMYPRQGIIPALYKQFPVKVIFSPPLPNNYYRRFFVLIGDCTPLFYDCMGTGYIRARGEIKEQRPAPIRHAHVQAYRNRSVAGLGVLSPDELDAIYEQGGGEETAALQPSPYFAHAGRVGTRALSVAALVKPPTRSGESVRPMVAPAHEFFVSDADMQSREVTINRVNLDFGFTPHMRSSQSQTVVIHNNTHAKVVVDWEIPSVAGLEKLALEATASERERQLVTTDRKERFRASLQAFAISPPCAEINPGSSVTFDVTFVPKQSSRNYVSELEAFVYFKNQRTFRLVNDYSLTPPFCVTVRTMGHTFPSGQLLAKATMLGGCVKNGKLVFPSTMEGEISYQTFMLRNTSNLPCTFRLEIGWDGQQTTGRENEIFSVKPPIGEIDAEDFTLVCVRFSPNSARKNIQLLRLYINGDEGGKLLLEGAGASPYLILPDLRVEDAKQSGTESVWGVGPRPPANIPKGPQGTFYLKPTCLGLSNERTLTLKNASRLPLRFKVSLNSAAAGVAMVTPKTGVLYGNEDTLLTISFAPKEAKTYEFVCSISVYPIGGKTLAVKDAMQPGPEVSPELLQSLTVRVVAQGETSALTFDPSRTTAEVRLVNTYEHRDIWLENISDSDLQYQLLYKEEFEPDAASLDPQRTISELAPLMSQDMFGSHANSANTSSNNNNHDADGAAAVTSATKRPSTAQMLEHSLFCERPTGILPARSRTRVVFTYQPRKAGLFEFLIYATVQAIDPTTKQPVMISNDQASLLRQGGSARDPSVETMSGVMGGGGGGGAEVEDLAHTMNPNSKQMASTMVMLPLMSNITARAAFPKLLVEDIRVESDLQVADIDSLWKRFSLAQLNYDLSIPMTHNEVLLNESSSPNLTELMTYRFEFCPAVLNSPLQTVVLQLRNNGYLTSEFRVQFPNEKKLELEAWCDEEEPSEELNRLVCIIEELKLFTVEPQRAILQPGESCTLTVTYRHSSLKYDGLHNLPLLIQLSQGKQFFIDLIGRTLPQPHPTQLVSNRRKSNFSSAVSLHSAPGTAASQAAPSTAASRGNMSTAGGNGNNSNNPKTAMQANPAQFFHTPDFLLVANTDNTGLMRLSPVPMGLPASQAPLQRIELINVSGVAVNYDVESASIDQLVEENYHCPVVRVVNPLGTIAPMSSIFLEIYFYPLESKLYEFPLKIKFISTPTNSGIRFTPSGNIETTASSGGDVDFGLPSAPGTAASAQVGPPLTGMSKKSNIAAASRAGGTRGSALTAPATAVAPPPPQPQYLNLHVQAVGYDPREKRPVLLESMYQGGVPPRYPLLTLPSQKVCLSEDLIDFSYIPQTCTSRRITLLTNSSPTSAYEFVVDESSCVLCVDGLLATNPLFGRIEPGESVVIEFAFSAFAQSMAFSERIKIMIREVIKGNNNKTSAARQALLKKFAAKKTVSVPHESIVARPTFARTAQLSNAYLPLEGQTATLPSTVNAKGKVVEHVKHEGYERACLERDQRIAAKMAMEDAMMAGFVSPYSKTAPMAGLQVNAVEDGDYLNMGSLAFSPGAAEGGGGNNNNIVEIDVPSRGGGGRKGGRGGGAVGFAMSPDDVASRGGGGPGTAGAGSRSQTAGAYSEYGGGGAGGRTTTGMTSRGDGMTVMTANTNRTDRTQPVMLGVPSTLIVRLRGDVYPVAVMKQLIQRNSDVEVIAEYAVPESAAFVPPVGKKYFDSAYREEQAQLRSKGKVNLALIKDRDSELRQITETVVDELFKSVMQATSMNYYMRSTLSGENPFVVDIPASSHEQLRDKESPASQISTSSNYGVYFREICPERSLLERLVIELKCANVLNTDLSSTTKAKAVVEKAGVSAPWTVAREQILAVDAGRVLMKLGDFEEAVLQQSFQLQPGGGKTSNMYELLMGCAADSQVSLQEFGYDNSYEADDDASQGSNVSFGAGSVGGGSAACGNSTSLPSLGGDPSGRTGSFSMSGRSDKNLRVSLAKFVQNLSRDGWDIVHRSVCRMCNQRRLSHKLHASGSVDTPVASSAVATAGNDNGVDKDGGSSAIASAAAAADGEVVDETQEQNEGKDVPINDTTATAVNIRKDVIANGAAASVTKADNPMKIPGFLDVANDALGSLMTELMQDLVIDNKASAAAAATTSSTAGGGGVSTTIGSEMNQPSVETKKQD